jgi:hypothetical protein
MNVQLLRHASRFIKLRLDWGGLRPLALAAHPELEVRDPQESMRRLGNLGRPLG